MQSRPFLIIMTVISIAALRSGQQPPERLRRADSFFGLHFDFHAGATDTLIGENVTSTMVQTLIDRVHPDFIQVDSKGHPGYSSYPTKVGHRVSHFVSDPLLTWRTVTAQNGVALYTHYSGVIDGRACETHPTWAVVDNNGARNRQTTSVFGPYADSLLIPQLEELAGQYNIDGAWVDGENWGTLPDYGERAVTLFQEKTGVSTIPKTSDDPHWFEWLQFHRQAFRDYLTHYISSVHAHYPHFQIASNWAYSSFMPEEISAPVDFISGDYTPLDAYNRARLEARVMAQQGVPWDLMAWGFTWNGEDPNAWMVKMPVQIEQEAAAVLSLGGGFQMYLSQRNDASINEWMLPLAEEAAKFCRARQPFCHQWNLIPQIGLILHTDAFYRRQARLFGSSAATHDPIQGILQNLLDSQHVVDVVMDHTLRKKINAYPLLIWPEWETITDEMKAMLLSYVERGGRLLIIGPKAAKLFEDRLGVKLLGEAKMRKNGLEADNWIASTNSLSQDVQLSSAAKPFGRYFDYWNKEGEGKSAASIATLGRGKIAAVYLNLGERYRHSASSVSRQFLASLVDQLFPEQLVRISGSQYVDVSLMQKGTDISLHLVNRAGPHADAEVHTYDAIPPIGPINVELTLSAKPKKVVVQPENRSVKFSYKDGRLAFSLDRLNLYDIIVISQ